MAVAGVAAAALHVATRAPGAVALALVGSWAAGRGRPDSDVDLVLLTDDPASLLRDDSWHRAFGEGAALVRTADFGALLEQRLRLPSGLEVELCIGGASWAGTEPVDDGTRRVVDDGLQVLWDPEGRLARLLEAVHGPS